MSALEYATASGAILNAFTTITPMKAVELVEAADITDARRIIADFAAAGLVKSYALVMETIDARGASACVRGPAIPAPIWQRVVQAGVADEVWTSGTVRLAGSDLVGGDPAAVVTGVTFKLESIVWVIAHHTGRTQARGSRQKTATVSAPDPVANAGAEEAKAAQAVRLAPDPNAIPPGALLATVQQAMTALARSRGTIEKKMNDGTLVRRQLGRSVRIEVDSIRAYATKGD